MFDPNPSSSGILPNPPASEERPIWFEDVIPTEQAEKLNRELWKLPTSSLTQKIIMFTVVVIPFLALVAGIILAWQNGYMNPLYLGLLIGGWILTGLGVTIGYHRLLAHRAFETYNWVRTFWMTLGAMSVKGSPLEWSATHRRHHEVSDQPGDPHSPYQYGNEFREMIHGFWHAHTGWLFTGHWSGSAKERYVPDLLGDRAMQFVDRYYYLVVAMSLLIPTAIGGLVMGTWEGAGLAFLWGGLARVCVTHHITWSVNSVCHIFGSRDYKSYDESRNNLIFGILAFGQGWHNNHHAFPTSARHGLKWWQFDSSWLIIQTMKLFGLAWNVKVPNARHMQSRSLAQK